MVELIPTHTPFCSADVPKLLAEQRHLQEWECCALRVDVEKSVGARDWSIAETSLADFRAAGKEGLVLPQASRQDHHE